MNWYNPSNRNPNLRSRNVYSNPPLLGGLFVIYFCQLVAIFDISISFASNPIYCFGEIIDNSLEILTKYFKVSVWTLISSITGSFLYRDVNDALIDKISISLHTSSIFLCRPNLFRLEIFSPIKYNS